MWKSIALTGACHIPSLQTDRSLCLILKGCYVWKRRMTPQPSANTLISRMTFALHYSTALLCACLRLGDRLRIKGRRKMQDVLGRKAITHIWGEAFVGDPAVGFDVMVSLSLPFLSSTSLAASSIVRGSRVAQILLALPQGLHSRLQLSAHI